MSRQTTIKTILDHPLVPVFYNADPEVSLGVFNACYAGRMRAFELTNRGANALETFKLLQNQLKNYRDIFLVQERSYEILMLKPLSKLVLLSLFRRVL